MTGSTQPWAGWVAAVETAVVAAEPHIAAAGAPGVKAVKMAHGLTRGAADEVGAARPAVEQNSSEAAMQPEMT